MSQESFSNKVAENLRARASGWERKHNSNIQTVRLAKSKTEVTDKNY